MNKSDAHSALAPSIAPLRRAIGARPKRPEITGVARALPLGLSTLELASPRWAAMAALKIWQTPHRHERPIRELAVDGRARQERVATPGGEVVTYTWEHGPELPWEGRRCRGTILLVHGWEGRASQLGSLVDPLRQAGYRVVGFDMPGHGRSPGKSLDLPTVYAVIGGVAKAIGPLAGVVAHSFGGAGTMGAMQRGLLSAPLVMIGSATRMRPGAEIVSKMLGLSDAGRAAFFEIIEERYGRDSWERTDLVNVCGDVEGPALIVHDVDDAEVPFEDALRLSKAWTSARLVATAGLGHRKILGEEPVIEEVVRFFLSTARTPSDLGTL
jgi:pimeloyl-ACP methyl ester carboxylesterase